MTQSVYVGKGQMIHSFRLKVRGRVRPVFWVFVAALASLAAPLVSRAGRELWRARALARAGRKQAALQASVRAMDLAAGNRRARAETLFRKLHLKVLAEDAATAVRDYKAGGEDVRHGIRSRLVQFEKDLASVHKQWGVTRASLQALGDLQLFLRRWEGATRTWDAFERGYPRYRRLAARKQAQSHLGVANELEARFALPSSDPAHLEGLATGTHFGIVMDRLRRAEEAAKQSKSVNQQRRVAAKYSRHVATHLAESASALIRSGDVRNGTSLMRAAVSAWGHSTVRNESLERLISHVAALWPPVEGSELIFGSDSGWEGSSDSLVARESPGIIDARADAVEANTIYTDIREIQSYSLRQSVLVCGFLYSGSSAVFEYLKGQTNAVDAFNGKELWCLKKANSFIGPLEADSSEDVLQSTAKAILTNIFGIYQTGAPLMSFYSSDDAQMREFLDIVVNYAQATRSAAFLPDLQRRRAELHSALVELLSLSLSLRVPIGRRAILNNIVPAYSLERDFGLFPDAKAICVLRDPRDQFLSQAMESPYARDAHQFVELMIERYAQFIRAVDDDKAGNRISVVRFEEFVSSESVRCEVATSVGLHTITRPQGEGFGFEASKSLKNVGIYRFHGSKVDVEYVWTALAKLYAQAESRVTVSG